MWLVRTIAVSSIVATIHFVLWLSLFSAAFEAVDAGESFPVVLGLALEVLGAPLMFLLYFPASTVGPSTSWWGDGASFIIGLAVPNSVLWACILVWAYRSMRRRRRVRSESAPLDPSES